MYFFVVRTRKHPGEALAEVGKESHAHHGIRHEIKKMETVGVHDIIEKIGERGAEPAGEVVNEERILIRAGLSKIGRDDVRGQMPCRLCPPQRPEVVLEVDLIDRRGEEGKLRSKRRQLALRHLLLPDVLGHSLALTGFGCHGGRERGEEYGAMGD